MTRVPARQVSPVLISWLTRPSDVESPVQDQHVPISGTESPVQSATWRRSRTRSGKSESLLEWTGPQGAADRIRAERQLRENTDDMRREKDRGCVISSERKP